MIRFTDLTPQQLRKAADLQEKIAELQAQLSKLMGGGEAPKAAAKPGKTGRKAKRVISPEGLARIRAAQRARWAKVKSAQAKAR